MGPGARCPVGGPRCRRPPAPAPDGPRGRGRPASPTRDLPERGSAHGHRRHRCLLPTLPRIGPRTGLPARRPATQSRRVAHGRSDDTRAAPPTAASGAAPRAKGEGMARISPGAPAAERLRRHPARAATPGSARREDRFGARHPARHRGRHAARRLDRAGHGPLRRPCAPGARHAAHSTRCLPLPDGIGPRRAGLPDRTAHRATMPRPGPPGGRPPAMRTRSSRHAPVACIDTAHPDPCRLTGGPFIVPRERRPSEPGPGPGSRALAVAHRALTRPRRNRPGAARSLDWPRQDSPVCPARRPAAPRSVGHCRPRSPSPPAPGTSPPDAPGGLARPCRRPLAPDRMRLNAPGSRRRSPAPR